MSAIRRLARSVAKAKMKKNGMIQVCSKDGRKGMNEPGVSYFSIHWREWAKK